MLPFASLPGILFALTSAIVWGSGDFSGGVATRRSNQFQVLALASLSGLLILIICAVLWREAFPSLDGIMWSIAAGVSGALGVAALYRALSLGQVASVAPIAAVVGAVLPVGFGILTVGLPTPVRQAGFVLAFVGIWLVSQPHSEQVAGSRDGILLACLAGIGFGSFFILIAQVESDRLFTPLVVARVMALGTALLLLRVNRVPLPSLNANKIALLAGVLDAGGNVFYLLATQLIRLDIAALLASLYPAATVVLAGLFLKEKISHRQGLGVGVCLLAIALITV